MCRQVLWFGLSLLIMGANGSYGQQLTKAKAQEFVQALVSRDTTLASFVLPEEREVSDRLGIQYDGVDFKFLLGYDIDNAIREGIQEKGLSFDTQIDSLHEDISLLKCGIAGRNYSRSYYFYRGFLVSPVFVHTRTWRRFETEHITFLVSDTSSFNLYSADRLEKFVQSMFDVLGFSDEQRLRLAKDKIVYVRCRDEEEIEKVTGFKTLGMFILAYDYVATTYNCHYHEVLHLLINFKLGTLPLYTHPLLQEGFAVAYGGRGGKEPRVILGLGQFLMRSGLLDYGSILKRDEFQQQDASFTYPLAGLYNLFLVNTMGIDGYMRLYRKYSGGEKEISGMRIDEKDLPDSTTWKTFLENWENSRSISFATPARPAHLFNVKDSLILLANDAAVGRIPRQAKYRITASKEEIRVLNLLTNNLIADYTVSLSWPSHPIPFIEGTFRFYVDHSVFDERPEDLIAQ